MVCGVLLTDVWCLMFSLTYSDCYICYCSLLACFGCLLVSVWLSIVGFGYILVCLFCYLLLACVVAFDALQHRCFVGWYLCGYCCVLIGCVRCVVCWLGLGWLLNSVVYVIWFLFVFVILFLAWFITFVYGVCLLFFWGVFVCYFDVDFVWMRLLFGCKWWVVAFWVVVFAFCLLVLRLWVSAGGCAGDDCCTLLGCLCVAAVFCVYFVLVGGWFVMVGVWGWIACFWRLV